MPFEGGHAVWNRPHCNHVPSAPEWRHAHASQELNALSRSRRPRTARYADRRLRLRSAHGGRAAPAWLVGRGPGARRELSASHTSGTGTCREVLAGLRDGARLLVDGLALGAMPEVIEHAAARLRIRRSSICRSAPTSASNRTRLRRLAAAERRALAAAALIIVTGTSTVALLGATGSRATRSSWWSRGRHARRWREAREERRCDCCR